MLFPETSVRRLSELAVGECGDFFALLAGRDRATTRDGKPYYRVTFRDANRSAVAMVWGNSAFFEDCDTKWRKGEFYKLRAKYEDANYGPQLELDRVRPVTAADADDGFDPNDFYESTRFDAAAMFRALVTLAEEQIADLPLRQLVVELLSEHEAVLVRLPAASKNHHAFAGGFVEHVLSVVRTAIFLADKYDDYYPKLKLSKDLVVAGATLHDIGKLLELEARPEGAEYTPAGRLIGHILLGRDLIRDKAREIAGLDPEVLLRLEHIIVSHHDTPEWGSPIAPATPEALLVHHADTLDAKFNMVAAALAAARPDETFTGYNNPLRRSLFRGLG